MYCPKQIPFFPLPKSPTAHGGILGAGKRKSARPVCAKRSMHVVLRAERARGRYSLLIPRNAKAIHHLLKKYAKQFEVSIYEFANVGTHLHCLLRAKTKAGFRNFLRVFSGQVAQQVTGAKPGNPLKKRFWDLLAYSRVVEWGRAFQIAEKYVRKNILQASRLMPFYPIRW